ncbi:MAG TPA: tetratricopeptide repeat protein [Pyrinomonadaceae bacterium]|jgi:DNA-binding winged helix-turn-helix (wHTH) protein/TolB-like protein/lipoprotein NlpI|nr:tetratricopeptide repeat protein [Pyrinomonadaceae bacterium]
MRSPVKHVYEFGPFRLDAEKLRLTRDGELVPLFRKDVESLLVLVRNPGRPLEREELMKAVWEDAAVEDANLTVAISHLRKALETNGETAEYIETIPRVGYRFVAEVREVLEEPAPLIIEKHTISRTVIEEEEINADARHGRDPELLSTARQLPASGQLITFGRRRWAILITGVVTIALVSAFFWMRGEKRKTSNSAVGIKSIAVLPLTNLGGNKDDEYLADGIADVLATRLSGLSALNVRPTRTTLAYKETLLDPLAVGRELQVDAVLLGSAQRVDDRVRVTLRLVKIGNQSTVWAGQFDEKLSDLLVMQDAIAEQVVSALSLRLSDTESEQLAHRYTTDADAQHLYLRGLYYWNTRREYDKAATYFSMSLEKDPNFALAHVGLGQVLATGEETQRSEASIREGLRLDPNLAEAHAALGFFLMFVQWKWDEAERELKRSNELKPGYAQAHQWYALLLAVRKRFPEAEGEMKRALELDPTSSNLNAAMGQIFYYARDYDEAATYCQKALTEDPNSRFGHEHLVEIYFKEGKEAEAITEFTKWHLLGMQMAAGKGDEQLKQRTEEAAKTGLKSLLQERVADLKENDGKARSPFWLAHAYAMLGNKEQALHWLEQAVSLPNHALSIAFIGVDPIFDDLRSDKRFEMILQQMNLPS